MWRRVRAVRGGGSPFDALEEVVQLPRPTGELNPATSSVIGGGQPAWSQISERHRHVRRSTGSPHTGSVTCSVSSANARRSGFDRGMNVVCPARSEAVSTTYCWCWASASTNRNDNGNGVAGAHLGIHPARMAYDRLVDSRLRMSKGRGGPRRGHCLTCTRAAIESPSNSSCRRTGCWLCPWQD